MKMAWLRAVLIFIALLAGCLAIEFLITVLPGLEPSGIRQARLEWQRQIAITDFFDRLRVYHPELEYTMAAGFSDTQITPEFSMYVRTRPLTDEIHIRDDAGSADIWFIGDSFGYGACVDESERVSDILERLTGRQALNLSTFGYGTMQEALLFKKVLAARPAPKILFHLIFMNDPFDDAAFEPADPATARKYGRIRSPSTRLRKYLRQHSSLYVLYGLIKKRAKEQEGALIRYVHGDRPYELFIEERMTSPDEALLAKGLGRTSSAVRDIRDVCAANAIRYVPVLIPLKEQLYLRKIDGQQKNADALDSFYDRLNQAVGGDAIDLLPIFRTIEEQGSAGLYFGIDGHWTAAGHAAVAGQLARRIDLP